MDLSRLSNKCANRTDKLLQPLCLENNLSTTRLECLPLEIAGVKKVNMIRGTEGMSFRRTLAASRPFITGIERSITIELG